MALDTPPCGCTHAPATAPVETPAAATPPSVTSNATSGTWNNDRYTIATTEAANEVLITDKTSGEQTRIWGDPHFDVGNDGTTEANFKGNMTVTLEDGTQVQIDTTPHENEGTTTASVVTIKDGTTGQVDQFTGIDSNADCDVAHRQLTDPAEINDVFDPHKASINVYANANDQVNEGKGFIGADGVLIDQAGFDRLDGAIAGGTYINPRSIAPQAQPQPPATLGVGAQPVAGDPSQPGTQPGQTSGQAPLSNQFADFVGSKLFANSPVVAAWFSGSLASSPPGAVATNVAYTESFTLDHATGQYIATSDVTTTTLGIFPPELFPRGGVPSEPAPVTPEPATATA